MNTKEITHKSVMTKEVIEHLNIRPGKTYIDATFGLGGHTRAILEAEPTCNVVAIDLDKKSLNMVAPSLQEEFGDRLTVLWGNFASLYRLLKKNKIGPVAGVLADFGTSQYQIFHREGFSFSQDSLLDMRMSNSHGQQTAADLVNTLTERDLAQLIFDYGQDRHGRRIAHHIVEERKKAPIVSTVQLAKIIEQAVPRTPRRKGQKKIHPATRTFRALRIAVNDEMNNLKHFLPAAFGALEDGGRIVCISFHSLEDRPVKHFFLDKEREGFGKVLTRKAVTASEDEIADNPSSRSAKLRTLIRQEQSIR